jgi:hypothetical protein
MQRPSISSVPEGHSAEPQPARAKLAASNPVVVLLVTGDNVQGRSRS